MENEGPTGTAAPKEHGVLVIRARKPYLICGICSWRRPYHPMARPLWDKRMVFDIMRIRPFVGKASAGSRLTDRWLNH